MIENLRYTMRAMQLFSRAQEVTANNLANLNTPGFKRDKLYQRSFGDLLYDQNVREVETYQLMNMQAGDFEQTGNIFDFAIEGNGFFQVEQDGKSFLTRNGRFHVDTDRFLRDENGGLIQGSNGSIYVPESVLQSRIDNTDYKIEVAKDGTIRINDVVIDKIRLVTVNDPSQLERRSQSYLAPQDGVEILDDNASQVNQGFYERGNVNPLEEMLQMTTQMRLFETSQRNMRSTDEMIGEVTTRLGRF